MGPSGGSHAHMIGRHLTDHLRKCWIALLLDTADEMGLPSDPEFRAAFVGYLEWGTRLAVVNSQDGVLRRPKASRCLCGAGDLPAVRGLDRRVSRSEFTAPAFTVA